MKYAIKIFLILSLFLCAAQLEAKGLLGLSVKAGVNLSDYYSSKMNDNDMKVGYNVGIAVDYRLDRNFYLLSGIELSSKGTREKGELLTLDMGEIEVQESHGVHFKRTWNPLYLQVPLHVGYVVNAAEDMNILFHIGPFVACGIGGNVKTKVTSHEGVVLQDEETDAFGKNGMLKRWDIGLGLGAGFEFKGLGINLGYDLGFMIGNSMYGLKNNTAHISLAYRFY